MPKIVLDSTEITRDPTLSGAQFKAFLEEHRRVGYELCVPSVVIEEVVEQHRREVVRFAREAAKSLKSLARLTSTKLSTAGDVDVDQAVNARRAHLIDTIEANQGTIQPHPSVTHTELAASAAARKRPFADDGSGYRDALVWHTVVDLLVNGDDVTFVSDDKDFWEGSKLHSDLIDDLKHHGGDPAKLKCYRTMKDFVAQEIKPLLRASLLLLGRQVEEGKIFTFGVADILGLAVQEENGGREWDTEDLGLDWYLASPAIDSVTGASEIMIVDIRRLHSGEVLMEIEATLDVDFDIYIDKSDAYAIAEEGEIYIQDWNWNDHLALGSVNQQLRGSFTVVFDESAPQDAVVDIDGLRARRPLDDSRHRSIFNVSETADNSF